MARSGQALPEFEKHTAEIWDGLKSPPAPDAYEARLAKDWRWIGCFSSYALTRLIETMSSDHSPFASESVQLPQLAAEFLNGNCAGTHALSANARQKLKALCKQ